MKKYGIDNARDLRLKSGSFCEIQLNNENLITIQKMIKSSDDKCYNCGNKDHFIKDCDHIDNVKKQNVINDNNIKESNQINENDEINFNQNNDQDIMEILNSLFIVNSDEKLHLLYSY